MKRTLAPLLLLSAVIPGLHAGPADRVILAAMKLSEQPNYTWSASVDDDASNYWIDGRTDTGGYTRVTMPMIESIRARLGRDASTRLDAIFNGGAACVIATDAGWQSVRELPGRTKREFEEDIVLRPSASSLGVSLGVSSLGGWPTGRAMAAPRSRFETEENRPYSNRALTVTPPHEELAIIVSSFATLEADGEIAVGTLTDLGAQLLLVRDGQEDVEPVAAAGEFRLWIRNGMVVRYSLKLEGVLMVSRRYVEVRQSSTTVVRNVGTTSIEVPAEARYKLAMMR